MGCTALDLGEFAETTRNSMEVRPLCLFGVEGHMGRLNDALFKPALPLHRNSDSESDSVRRQKTLVFFGGDIQNFIHLMDQDDPRIKYNRWCLEAAAIRLGKDFPSHHIVVIKPTRIVCDHISCFDNFVEGNFLGMPRHVYHYNGLLHMEKLLKKISMKIKQMQSEELFKMLLKKQDDEDFMDDENPSDVGWQYEMMSKEIRQSLFKWQKSLRLHKYPLTLVAFSKGCVVLNQFLYEFHFAKRLEPWLQDSSIVERIEAMYWLDAGHPGKKNVYLTSRGLIKTLSELGIDIHLHVSLYQTEDFNRPWVRWQCKEFSDMLIQMKANVIPMRHDSWPIDLESHFDVLMSFKRLEAEREACVRVQLQARGEGAAGGGARAASSPAPPPAPPPARANPLDRSDVARREILGLSLISPHDTPYLGLRTVLRHPYAELTQTDPPDARHRAGAVRTLSQLSEPLPVPLLPRMDPRNFTVLLSKESLRIDFNEDLEAARALREEYHCAVEEPVIALPSARAEPGVHVYGPCEEMYVPVVVDEFREGSEDSLDSSSAATPRPLEPAAAPPDRQDPDDMEEYSLSDSPSPGSVSVASAPTAPWNVPASTSEGTPRAARANISQGAPGAAHYNYSQGTPRAAHANISQGSPGAAHYIYSQGSPGAAHYNYSQGTPRAAHANISQSSPGTAHYNYSQGPHRAAHANISQGSPGAAHYNYSQGTPRPAHVNNSQGTPRAAYADTLQDTLRPAHTNNSQGTHRAAYTNTSQDTLRPAHANNSQDTARAAYANNLQGDPRAAHTNTSQGTARVVHANTLQSTPRTTHGDISQGIPRPAYANTLQGTPEIAHASTSQGAPRDAQASTSQGIPMAAHASTSLGTPRDAHANILQGIPRAEHTNISQGIPRAAHASTSQGIPRDAQPSTLQGTPRDAQANILQAVPRAEHANISQGIPRDAQPSTLQGTPRNAQANILQSISRAAHANTSQGISRDAQPSTLQGTPRDAQANILQSIPRAEHANISQGIPRDAQPSTLQGTPRNAQANILQGIPRAAHANTSQDTPRAIQDSMVQGISRSTQANTLDSPWIVQSSTFQDTPRANPSQGISRGTQASSQSTRRARSRFYNRDTTAYLGDRSTSTRYNLRSLRSLRQ